MSSKVSGSANIARGKRLETFLEFRFPDMAWLARSRELGFIDNTVIGWRKGRDISGDGIAKLHELGCDIYWLLTGNSERGAPSPPVSARGEEGADLRHLSRMAVELVDIVNNFHRRALEGVITEEQFEKILLGATGGMIGAAEECGVEPKKAIG